MKKRKQNPETFVACTVSVSLRSKIITPKYRGFAIFAPESKRVKLSPDPDVSLSKAGIVHIEYSTNGYIQSNLDFNEL